VTKSAGPWVVITVVTFLRQQVGALSPLPACEDMRTVAHLHTHPSLRTLHVTYVYTRRIFQGALDS
jgi:hypothetical protein